MPGVRLGPHLPSSTLPPILAPNEDYFAWAWMPLNASRYLVFRILTSFLRCQVSILQTKIITNYTVLRMNTISY